MPGLLIFVGIGIIFITLLKASDRRRGRQDGRRDKRNDGDDSERSTR